MTIHTLVYIQVFAWCCSLHSSLLVVPLLMHIPSTAIIICISLYSTHTILSIATTVAKKLHYATNKLCVQSSPMPYEDFHAAPVKPLIVNYLSKSPALLVNFPLENMAYPPLKQSSFVTTYYYCINNFRRQTTRDL